MPIMNRSRIQSLRKLPGLFLTILLGLSLSWAMEKPTIGQLQSYAKDGSLNLRVRNALALENHVVAPDLARDFNAQIERIRLIRAGSVYADINQDLGVAPIARNVLPSKGTVKVFALLISFPDYPASQSSDSIAFKLFGEGDSDWPYESLRNYYRRSSYNMLNIEGNVLDWYTASYARAAMPQTPEARENLIKEALLFYLSQGHDFSQYDNDGDGSIDYFMVIWTGPDNGWGGFWWGYQTSLSDPYFSLNGKKLTQTRYAWLRDSRPNEPAFSPKAAIHETGHALGLPDYYDYGDQTGPRGGIGSLDMMDGECGDHNPFSKMLLGWISPQVFSFGKREFSLNASGNSQDTLLIVPESSPANPVDEFFLVQNRFRAENDFYLPGDGLLIWRVDARVGSDGLFQSDNSSTERKLLSLIEGNGKFFELKLDSSLLATTTGPSLYGIGPSGQVQSITVDSFNLYFPQPSPMIQASGSGNTVSTMSSGIVAVASGATYYVDATGGNDSNSGLSIAAAWKTIQKVNSSRFSPGDTILFKRGEIWREQLVVWFSGSVGNPITFGAYGTGDKPIIMGSKNLSTISDWTVSGANIWVTTAGISTDVGNLIFNNEASVGVKKSALRACANQGDFYYDAASGFLYIYSVRNPGTYYAVIEAAQLGTTRAGIDISERHHITIQDLSIKYEGGHGIQLGGTDTNNLDYIIVERCSLSYIGGSYLTGTTRYGNGIEQWDGGTNITVRYNCIDNAYDAGITTQGQTASKAKSNQRFYYNIVTNCEYGFEFWHRGAGSVTDGLFVENNVFYNNGGGWSHAQRPDPRGTGLIFWNFANGGHSNLFFRNNIVHTSINQHIFFAYPIDDLSGWTFDYNDYYTDGAAFLKNGTTTNFAGWKTATSQDAHSVVTDPLFVSPSTGDFHLQAGSPCINAGADVGLTTDYAGSTVPQGAAPDIGAYESGPSTTTTPPTVITIVPSAIQFTSATAGGNVTSDGGAAVTQRGVCWGLTANPTISGAYKQTGSGTGSYTTSLTDLTPGTTYHVRAYATNSQGSSYGSDVVFTTSNEIRSPTVTTSAVTSSASTGATAGGNVTSDGGAAVTQRGVCWGLTANPTISGSYKQTGSGTGSYTTSLTGLTSGTTYHVRAYAINSQGMSYGSDVAFTTTQDVASPTVTTSPVRSIRRSSAAGGGSVTSEGGATVTGRGVCWGLTPNPTISGSHTLAGSGTGSYASRMTGLTPDTTYHVRAYATNSSGTSYGNDVAFTTAPERSSELATQRRIIKQNIIR